MAKTCQLNAFYIYLIYKAWIVIPDMLNKFSSKVSNTQTMLKPCMGGIWVDPMATSNLSYKGQFYSSTAWQFQMLTIRSKLRINPNCIPNQMFNYLLYVSKPLELGSVDYGHCMWAERNVAMNAKINMKLYSSICSTLIGEVNIFKIYFIFLT